MQLSETQLKEIVGTANIRTGGFEPEKRSTGRCPRPIRAGIIRITNGVAGRPESVRLRDVSATGVGFLRIRPMPVGEEFIIALPRRASGFLLLRCVVTRCQAREAGLFAIGARFIAEAGKSGEADVASAATT